MIKVNKNFIFKWMVVDGCRSGWVISSIYKNNIYISYINNLAEINSYDLSTIYIDIPLKLPQSIINYPRKSDKTAKKHLGKYHSSIFYAPLMDWLDLPFAEINKKCKKYNKPKLSIQSFNLFKKISEVQEYYKKYPSSFIEIHPELIIHYFLNHKYSKKTVAGQNQRLDCLNNYFATRLTLNHIYDAIIELKNNFPKCKLTIDDIIDSIFVSCVIDKLIISTPQHKNGIIVNDDLYNRVNLFK